MRTNLSRRRMVLAAAAVAVALVTAACPGNFRHTYDGFTGAVDKGAPCAELFDQRQEFSNTATLARIDAELARIGCTTAGARRTDSRPR